MSDRFILNGHQPVNEPDLLSWARWMETADRRVAQTRLPNGTLISTVFLGLDHSFRYDGAPVLFETMIFGCPLDGETERYCTWDEAAAGHLEVVARAKKAIETA